MSTLEKYTVVVTGVETQGPGIAQAKEAFASLFKISVEKTEPYFDGTPRILRRNLAGKEAQVYANALKKIGLAAKLLPQEEPGPAPQELQLEPMAGEVSPAAGAAPGLVERAVGAADNSRTMICPKCNVEQPEAPGCSDCGIIVEKYLQAQSNATPRMASVATAPHASAEVNDAVRQTHSEQEQDTVEDDDSLRLSALGAAAVAALLGALLWMLIAVTFGYELGIVAWAIGGAVGFAAALFGGKGHVCGAACGVLALVAIMGGKYLTVQSFQADISSAMASQDIWDAETEAFFEGLKVDASLYQELDGSDESLREFLQTREYTDAANAGAVTQEDIDIFHEFHEATLLWVSATAPSYEQWQAHTLQSISDYSTLDLLMEDFGILDALFIFLGIGTAFRLGSGNRD